jgi:peroxiredoxin
MQRGWVSLGVLALVGSSVLVVTLAHQDRALRKEVARLRLREQSLHQGLVVPSFRTVTLEGDSVFIADSATHNRDVLFVFTTTCGFCRQAIPSWHAIAGRAPTLRAWHVRVFGVSLDPDSITAAFAATNALGFPVIRFPNERTAAMYRARAVPLTAVVDYQGRVLYGRPGVPSAASLDTLFAVLRRPDSAASAPRGSSSTVRRST